MDHQKAVEIGASERYITGGLAPADRDEFEEHFADCTACMESVETALIFVANARSVFRDESWLRKLRWPSWVVWVKPQVAVPAFTSVALAAVAAYQLVVTIPVLQAPRAIGPAIVLNGETRGPISKVVAGSPLRFQMALESAPVDGITAALTDLSGKTVSSGSLPAPAPGQPLDVYFPIRLSPGRYAVIVRAGRSGAELVRNEIEIVRKGVDTP